jgi:predicted transcriptional regulator of viral defense system
MSREKRITPSAGIELVRKLAAEGDRIFSTDRARELAPTVGMSEGYLRQALHHLVRSGWLIRVRKGLYAISSAMPGISPVHEFEIAMALVSPAAISHWSAMHYHGLTDQAPRDVFVLTTTEASVPRRSARDRRRHHVAGYLAGETNYRFVQTKPRRYFGTEKVWVGEARVTITDPERTLIDGLLMPRYCGDFAEVLHAFEVRGDQLDMERIIRYALRLDAATVKRLGWALEATGLADGQPDALLTVPVKGYRRLDPTGPRRGRCNRRWMIQENLPGRTRI